MPPPPVRESRVCRAFREVEEARVARWIREFHEDRANEVTEWVRQHVERPGPNEHEPELVLDRATILLACICLFCLGLPDESNQSITNVLRPSFPDISFDAHDVDDIFHATCRNRPAWVSDMHRYNEFQQRVIRTDLLELLRSNVIAHMRRMPSMPLGPNHDRRDAIRFLEALVDVHDEGSR